MRKWIEIIKVLRELKVKSSRAATLITYRQLTIIIKPNNVELWVDGNLWLEPDFLKICCIKEPIDNAELLDDSQTSIRCYK